MRTQINLLQCYEQHQINDHWINFPIFDTTTRRQKGSWSTFFQLAKKTTWPLSNDAVKLTRECCSEQWDLTKGNGMHDWTDSNDYPMVLKPIPVTPHWKIQSSSQMSFTAREQGLKYDYSISLWNMILFQLCRPRNCPWEFFRNWPPKNAFNGSKFTFVNLPILNLGIYINQHFHIQETAK